jgi:predicted RNA-binding Zn-ribbon protein involved in translation (DUF1610 family)
MNPAPWRNPATFARCDEKKGYNNEQIALKLARKASIKAGYPIVEYLCPDCGFWHIGRAQKYQLIADEQEQERINRAGQPLDLGPQGNCPNCTREKCCGNQDCRMRRRHWYRRGRLALQGRWKS